MNIWWADLAAKFKRRLSQRDVTRIATRMAECGINGELIAPLLKKLHRHDVRKDWFPTEWQLQFAPIAQRISSRNSRNAQGLQCRRELLAITENLALYQFVVRTDNDDLRDYWWTVNYAEKGGLTEQSKSNLLVTDYVFSLLNELGLGGLHWQQFNKEVDVDEIRHPYMAICGMDTEISCLTQFASAMREAGRDDLELVASNYLGLVSEPLSQKIREARDEYAAWISAGNISGIERFRDQFKSLLSAHSAAMDLFSQSKSA
jgi:hypothetical protein